MVRFRFQVLGPIGCEQRLEPDAVRLLGLLLVHANRPVADEQLRGRQEALVRLRTVLGEALYPVPGGHFLRVGAREQDADAFSARVLQGRRALEGGEPLLATELLTSALGMWRGPAYAEVATEPFALDEVRRLDALHTEATQLVSLAQRRVATPAAVATVDASGARRPGRPGAARLLVGPRQVALDPARQLTIGRSATSDVVLADDKRVSRTHALLACVGGTWVVSDDGLSANGTWCNGRRVHSLQRLEDGDILRVGGTLIVFRNELEPMTPADAEDATLAV